MSMAVCVAFFRLLHSLSQKCAVLKRVEVPCNTLKHSDKRQKHRSLWDLYIVSKSSKMQEWCGRCYMGTMEHNKRAVHSVWEVRDECTKEV